MPSCPAYSGPAAPQDSEQPTINMMQVLAFNILCCLLLTVLLMATGAGWFWGLIGGGAGGAVVTFGAAMLIVWREDRAHAEDAAQRAALIKEWEQDQTAEAAVASELQDMAPEPETQRSA